MNNYNELNSVQRMDALSRITRQCAKHCRVESMTVSFEEIDKLVISFVHPVKGMPVYDSITKKIAVIKDFSIGFHVVAVLSGNMNITVTCALAGKEATEIQQAMVESKLLEIDQEFTDLYLGALTRTKAPKPAKKDK